MSFFDLAKKRRTTFEFSEKKVKKRDIQKILQIARLAPSSNNTQPWKFIVIEDPHMIDQIVKRSVYGAFHTDPPVLIAVVLDPVKKESHFTKEMWKTHAYFTIMMPVMNMVYQAKDLGIDSCILSLTPKEFNAPLLIPKKSELLVAIGFGYESKRAYKRPQQRKQFDDIVYYEHYGSKKEETKN
jgi:nitroreductase